MSDGTRTVDREALVTALREYAAKGGIETPTGLIPLSTSFALMVADELDRDERLLKQVEVVANNAAELLDLLRPWDGHGSRARELCAQP